MEKYSTETLYKYNGTPDVSDVSIKMPADTVSREKPFGEELREKSYEYGLPEYLQQDLDAFKEGLKIGSSLMDCLWGELYGSINTVSYTHLSTGPGKSPR